MIDRRSFLGLGAIALCAAGSKAIAAAPCSASKTSCGKVKFKFGMAGFSCHRLSLDETLKLMQKLDLHYLCIKDFHLPIKSTQAEIDAFKQKCADFGVTGYGVGPIYMKTEAEADRAFAYARRVGVKVLVGVPDYEILPYVDKKLKEYPEILYAIHLHGPDIEIFQNATVIWNKVKDLDPRLGMCLDIGHDLRDGCDPVADMKKYHSRIFDMHIKDVTDSTKAGHAIELGRGKIDFVALFNAMRKVGYSGMCSLEYEKDMDNPFMGIAESFGYLKAIFQTA